MLRTSLTGRFHRVGMVFVAVVSLVLVAVGVVPVPGADAGRRLVVGCGIYGEGQVVARADGRQVLLVSKVRHLVGGGVERDDQFVLSVGGVIRGCRHMRWVYERGKIEVLEDNGWGEDEMGKVLMKAVQGLKWLPVGNTDSKADNGLSYLSRGYRGDYVIRVAARDRDMCELGRITGCGGEYRNWYFVRLFPVIDANSNQFLGLDFPLPSPVQSGNRRLKGSVVGRPG